MEDNDLFVMERVSLCNGRKIGRISMSVFGGDDFERDRKEKGERGEKKLFWLVWLEGKRGGDFGGAYVFSPRTHQKNQSPNSERVMER